jgi:hypothetical protein
LRGFFGANRNVNTVIIYKLPEPMTEVFRILKAVVFDEYAYFALSMSSLCGWTKGTGELG